MTKKDYIKIARTLSEIRHTDTLGIIAERFSDMLALDNEKFDKKRFIQAVMKP